jgi:hypothetical protein
VYDLVVGRRRPDGEWLAVERKPFISLRSTYPLATIRVLGRTADLRIPEVEHTVEARFGDSVQLLGYNLETGTGTLALTLFWKALSPTETRLKMFLHLVAEGETGEVRAQSDRYPHLPTTAWLPGEYLSDEVNLDLPSTLPTDRYSLLLGWYDEATGSRLPVFDAAGDPLGDSVVLGELELGQ